MSVIEAFDNAKPTELSAWLLKYFVDNSVRRRVLEKLTKPEIIIKDHYHIETDKEIKFFIATYNKKTKSRDLLHIAALQDLELECAALNPHGH